MRGMILPCLLLGCTLIIAGCGQSGQTEPSKPEFPSVTQTVSAPESEPDSEQPSPDLTSAEVTPEVSRAALDTLKAHLGKDLTKLEKDQVEELLRTITKLLPKRHYRDWFDFRPWRVWEFQEKGERPFWLLLDVDNTRPHPGSTGIRITELDDAGKALSETTFWTGHRCYMRRIKWEKVVDGEFSLLLLEIGFGAGPGPNIYKQYYAKVGSRFDLVRLEDFDGNATRNRYYVRHFACGSAIPKQSEAEWEADLRSRDRLKVLRALVWLGGTHWDLQAKDKPETQVEDFAEINLVRKVRANKKVVTRLKELANSEDRWLREAAQLASHPKDDRF
jgi:hypothetical protein